MRARNRTWIACGLAMIMGGGALASANEPPQSVTIGPRFVMLSEASYEIKEATLNDLDVQGPQSGHVQQTASRSMRVAFKVVQVGESGVTLDMTYLWISLTSQSPLPNESFSFDSDQPLSKDAGNPLAPVIRPLIGAPLTLTLGPGGDVRDLRAPAGLIPSLPMSRYARQFIDPAQTRLRLQELLSTASGPDQRAVGESWTNELFIGEGNDRARAMRLAWTRTLQKSDEAHATIALRGAITLPPSPDPNTVSSIEQSDVHGEVVWDLVSGLAVSLEQVTELRTRTEGNGVVQTLTTKERRRATRIK